MKKSRSPERASAFAENRYMHIKKVGKIMRKHMLMITAAGVLWGLLSLFFRFFTGLGMDAMQAVFIRNGAAAVLMLLYLGIRKPEKLRLRKLSDIRYFIGTGMISLAFFNFCYFVCIDLAGVSVAALLLYTAPAFVMLMSAVLFGEQINAVKIAALGLTIAGCACVTGAFGGGMAIGWKAAIVGLCSGLGYALYTIFGKYALRDYTSETITAYTVLFAALGTLPFSRPLEMLPMINSPLAVLLCIAGGLFCTVAPYLLYTKGLEGVASGQASILATVEPVVAALVGILVFRESVTLGKLVGITLILAAIVMMSTAGQESAIRKKRVHGVAK